MTNTHITIGGHKITTNKVGQVHTATNGASATGTVRWTVSNGICFIGFTNVSCPVNTTIATNVPQAKMGGAIPLTNRLVWVTGNPTRLDNGAQSALAGEYFLFSYPVADDWVES
jgi:hypothetical protein